MWRAISNLGTGILLWTLVILVVGSSIYQFIFYARHKKVERFPEGVGTGLLYGFCGFHIWWMLMQLFVEARFSWFRFFFLIACTAAILLLLKARKKRLLKKYPGENLIAWKEFFAGMGVIFAHTVFIGIVLLVGAFGKVFAGVATAVSDMDLDWMSADGERRRSAKRKQDAEKGIY